MSERAPHHHESQEHLPSHEKHEKQPAHHEKHEKAHHAEKQPDIEAIKHSIEKQAKSAKETRVDSGSEKDDAQHYLVTKGLKQEAFKRSLQRARKHMSATSRGFSKVIHQPVVDAVSNVGAKTIARPTGILTGAVIALAGSSYLLWSAKHYGYQYNYLTFLILFAGGYLIGLAFETLIYLARRLSSRG